MSDDVRGTAIHEAAHAVIARALSIPVKRISIVPSDDFLGHCRHAPLSFDSIDDPNRADAERHALIAFAGGIAEQLCSPNQLPECAVSGDYEKIADLAVTLWADEETADAWIRFLAARATAMLRSPHVWTQVVAVADALMQCRELDAAEFERICTAAVQNEVVNRHARPALVNRARTQQG